MRHEAWVLLGLTAGSCSGLSVRDLRYRNGPPPVPYSIPPGYHNTSSGTGASSLPQSSSSASSSSNNSSIPGTARSSSSYTPGTAPTYHSPIIPGTAPPSSKSFVLTGTGYQHKPTPKCSGLTLNVLNASLDWW